MKIRFTNVRLPLGRDRRLIIPDWTLSSREFWVIVGESGSGKSVLARTLAGVDTRGRNLRRIEGMDTESLDPDRTAWIAFEREQLIREQLRRDDESEETGTPDEGMSIEEFLDSPNKQRARDFIRGGTISFLAGRGIRQLSTGEFRQALIAREAGREPHLAVLDVPFEGLDVSARPRLKALLADWFASASSTGLLLVLTVNRREDIPEEATHIAVLQDDHLAFTGPLESGLDNPLVCQVLGGDTQENTTGRPPVVSRDTAEGTGFAGQRIPDPPCDAPLLDEVLIRMNNLCLSFNNRPILKNINWTVRRGESWLITGPNGSGKTTLMNLIIGDEPRGYGQDLYLFGRKRGTGETLADIRKNLSLVSAAWQELVSSHSTAVEIVGSGLHDSLIPGDSLGGFEETLSRKWLQLLGMEEKTNQLFFRLSYGEKRLVMIARAMIKHPALLVLDEPMHGLDVNSRYRVSRLVETLIEQTGTTVLFVSHRPADAPTLIRNHLELRPLNEGGPAGAVVSVRQYPDD